MRQEVIDFYAGHKIPIDKLVQAGARQGLYPSSVKAAAEKVYESVQAGEKIEPIRLAWETFGRAERRHERVETLDNIQKSLDNLDAKFTDFMIPWYKKLWRCMYAGRK